MPASDEDVLRLSYSAIDGLRSWTRGGQKAPHKPLLVLLALSRAKAGESRLSEFNAIESPLRSLLMSFGPERTHYHPEYPFWRLQSDGIWEVPGGDKLPRRASNTDPPASVLRERRVRGGFIVQLHSALRADPARILSLARFTAETHLPEVHAELLEHLGLE